MWGPVFTPVGNKYPAMREGSLGKPPGSEPSTCGGTWPRRITSHLRAGRAGAPGSGQVGLGQVGGGHHPHSLWSQAAIYAPGAQAGHPQLLSLVFIPLSMALPLPRPRASLCKLERSLLLGWRRMGKSESGASGSHPTCLVPKEGLLLVVATQKHGPLCGETLTKEAPEMTPARERAAQAICPVSEFRGGQPIPQPPGPGIPLAPGSLVSPALWLCPPPC